MDVNMFLEVPRLGAMSSTLSESGLRIGCCSPAPVDPLSTEDADRLAARFKAIADPVRLKILNRIGSVPGGVCVCDIVDDLDKSQPTISHHMKILTEAGLVTREKRGRWAWYSVIDEEIAALRDALS